MFCCFWCHISNQHLYCPLQVLGDDDKRARYDRGEDIEETGMGGGGFNFGGGGQQFTFHFEGGFPGGFGGDGGFPGGFGFNFWFQWSKAYSFTKTFKSRVVSISRECTNLTNADWRMVVYSLGHQRRACLWKNLYLYKVLLRWYLHSWIFFSWFKEIVSPFQLVIYIACTPLVINMLGPQLTKNSIQIVWILQHKE